MPVCFCLHLFAPVTWCLVCSCVRQVALPSHLQDTLMHDSSSPQHLPHDKHHLAVLHLAINRVLLSSASVLLVQEVAR